MYNHCRLTLVQSVQEASAHTCSYYLGGHSQRLPISSFYHSLTIARGTASCVASVD